jgi:hypothetical protein
MAVLNHDDVLQLRRVGHEIGDQALTGKFPVRNVSDDVQQLLQQRFAILLDGTKPKWHCYNCKWSSTQKGYCRPLEHVCLQVLLKDAGSLLANVLGNFIVEAFPNAFNLV